MGATSRSSWHMPSCGPRSGVTSTRSTRSRLRPRLLSVGARSLRDPELEEGAAERLRVERRGATGGRAGRPAGAAPSAASTTGRGCRPPRALTFSEPVPQAVRGDGGRCGSERERDRRRDEPRTCEIERSSGSGGHVRLGVGGLRWIGSEMRRRTLTSASAILLVPRLRQATLSSSPGRLRFRWPKARPQPHRGARARGEVTELFVPLDLRPKRSVSTEPVVGVAFADPLPATRLCRPAAGIFMGPLLPSGNAGGGRLNSSFCGESPLEGFVWGLWIGESETDDDDVDAARRRPKIGDGVMT